MAKAVAVGPRAWVAPFRGVGFESVQVEEPEDLLKALLAIAGQRDVSLVLVSEVLAGKAPAAIEEFRKRSRAVICALPTHEGATGTGYEETRRLVESSLGIDLLGGA